MVNKLVVILVIILGAIAVAQIMRISELTSQKSKENPEDIPENENQFNRNLLLVFMVALHAFLIWLMIDYGHIGLGPAASTQGVIIDGLFHLQWILVFIVYFACVTILFYFAWKYSRKKGVKAYYYPHNNTLEMIWTTIPAAVLSVMIIVGLKAWNEITSPATAEYVNVEIFGEQFKWTARYSGMNNKLGKFDYKLTTDENPYAIMTKENIQTSLTLMRDGGPGVSGIKQMEEKLNDPTVVLSKKDHKKLVHDLHRNERLSNLLEAMEVTYNDSLDALANDDVIVEDSLYLLKGQKYNFHLRSKDIIHSAYFPQFRQQMNTVPGMTTFIKLQPIYTTKQMKKLTKNPEYEFALMCNKICGGSHYKMKMSVVVLGPEDYLNWQKTKETYDGSPWIKGNEDKLLEYYRKIASRVDKK